MPLNNPQSVSCEIGNRTLTIETGKLAKQANGSVFVSYGDTRVLVTLCCSDKPREGANFLPLTVEFSEKFYSSGRIPGSFFKREGRPTKEATLSARMIDRPLRPLFPEGFYYDTQIVATILSLDLEGDIDICAAAGASAALHISDIPFNGPTAAMRMGLKDGKYIVAPSWTQVEENDTDLEILVAGTEKGVTMVEGGACEQSEEVILGAILAGHAEIKKIVQCIESLRKLCGKTKRELAPPETNEEITGKVAQLATEKLASALKIQEKIARYENIAIVKDETLTSLVPESLKEENPNEAAKVEKFAKEAFDGLKYSLMRNMILDEKVRIDGRDTETIRPIEVEVGLLPRTHGSALFTRGETQVLSTITLGTKEDEGIIDTIHKRDFQRFFLHYNFPPFSVGESGRMGGQSRREIGHGALAERAIIQVMPAFENFSYTTRIVCETLESNGSSSMGSVCAASMALMDAGVPVAKPVAGIAMGLIKEGEKTAILSDILGDEDHLGDMDFKVAGTKDGITGIQMDIKIDNVSEDIMKTALAQAHKGRLHILGEMSNAITDPRTEKSSFAPDITTFKVPVAKIGAVVGPGGKVIKNIIAETGCKVNIDDDGTVNIASTDSNASKQALQMVKDIVTEAEEGKTYKGVVKKVVEFGAFVAVLPNQEGLLHISEIAHERVNKVDDYLKEGDEVEVKVLEIDQRSGKMRLSRKALLERNE